MLVMIISVNGYSIMLWPKYKHNTGIANYGLPFCTYFDSKLLQTRRRKGLINIEVHFTNISIVVGTRQRVEVANNLVF